MNDRPLVAYEPNPALAWLYQSFFAHIVVDQAWVEAVREADSRGTVVYVLRNLSFIDFFALDYLTKRYQLPEVRFANDLGLWVLEPMGRGWLHALFSRTEASDADDLQRAVRAGESAALFLKRPPNLFEPMSRKGKIEGDLFIRTLFQVQRTSPRPILLVPQVFVWSKHPDEAQHSAFDAVLGSREWPGKLRTIAQFMMNYRHVTLRAGEPVDVRAFLRDGAEGGRVLDATLVRRMTYTLLRRLERERRAVVGPTKKPADRLREEVVRSPKLQKVIGDMAGEGDAERRVLTLRAYAMVREMEAALDMNTIAGIDKGFEAVVSRMYAGLEVDEEGLARVRAAAKDGTLVLLPSHKSHVDYMILAYLFYRHYLPLPIVAAGDNLSFFPLGPVFRRAGAFFIRRNFHGDRLYGAVVDAYMRRLVKDGFTLEFFLEGGRSRTGKLLPPKVGLLSLVVDAALGVTTKKVHFVPISIGYERVVEEKEFVREVSGAEKKQEDVRGLLATAGLVRGRYGRLNVQFGTLLTLEGVLDEIDQGAPTSGGDGSHRSPERMAKLTPARRRAVVTRLAYRVMNEINRVTAVTPGALVATALLTHRGRGIAHPDVVEACQRLARTLHAFGARFTPSLGDPQSLRASAVREACELFARAGHVEVRTPGLAATGRSGGRARPGPEAIYVVPDEARLSLDLSKNIVIHFFVSRAMVATALTSAAAHDGGATSVGPPSDRAPEEALRERVRALSRLFKYEFQFRADASFEQIFEETLAAMQQDGELLREGGVVRIAGEEGLAQVTLYAECVRNFVEGYRVAARGLVSLLKGPVLLKDAAKRAIAVGERMFLAGEIERREAVSRPVIENAYAAFIDQGYVARVDGKIALPESYATAIAVRTIEARIAGYLTPIREPPA